MKYISECLVGLVGGVDVVYVDFDVMFVLYEVGYVKQLKLWYVQMIVMGGVIGIGFFFGVGGCL